jgi:parallel beta-helix repeat protein
VAALGATGLLAVGSGEPAGAGTLAACPSPITSNTTLTSDCAGPIYVEADNVRLNLAGHTVFCGEPDSGINILFRTGVSVLYGRVVACPDWLAVLVFQGGGHRLVGLHTQADPDAVAVFLNNTHDNVVRHVTAVNSFAGLWLAASDNNRIVHNRFVGNDTDGLLLLFSDSNLVAGNRAFLNTETGIRSDNLSTGNRFVFNAALFNGTDLRDDHGDCSANQWAFNFFQTSSPPCIG